jgi:hypothetical protein
VNINNPLHSAILFQLSCLHHWFSKVFQTIVVSSNWSAYNFHSTLFLATPCSTLLINYTYHLSQQSAGIIIIIPAEILRCTFSSNMFKSSGQWSDEKIINKSNKQTNTQTNKQTELFVLILWFCVLFVCSFHENTQILKCKIRFGRESNPRPSAWETDALGSASAWHFDLN